MKSSNQLQTLLHQIDRKSYPAYKDTRGCYDFQTYTLSIDHVQGDPFASPSKLSILVDGKKAGFPAELFDRPFKRIALQDYLTRSFYKNIQSYSFQAKGSGKSGLLSVSRCGQEILERTACEINPANGAVTLRFEAGFPARGRTIDAAELIRILFQFLPPCVTASLFYQHSDRQQIRELIQLSEDQQSIREQLEPLGLCAFIADGSILPRESGVSARPLKQAVAFSAPDSLKTTITVPHRGKLCGMGIKKGVFLIVGGGYHGKSTLLKALEAGVYNHIPGDGREYVITDATAVKIRAEDGRSIKKTDISMFINNLPNQKDTVSFYTEDASGSTSQAANVVEAIEAQSKLLLIDEDTSATNFMIRDELMQQVVARDQEPITPFIERVRVLYEQQGISSIIVAGSSGSYFHVADCIIQMDQYHLREITALAKQAATAFPPLSANRKSGDTPLPTKPAPAFRPPIYQRTPKPQPAFKSNDRIKVKTFGKDSFQLNRETVELRYAEQLVDPEQLTALSYILIYLEKHRFNGRDNLRTILKTVRQRLDQQGLIAVLEKGAVPPAMAMPRDQEILAAINRYRSLRLEQ